MCTTTVSRKFFVAFDCTKKLWQFKLGLPKGQLLAWRVGRFGTIFEHKFSWRLQQLKLKAYLRVGSWLEC